jgi:hypothetical protein
MATPLMTSTSTYERWQQHFLGNRGAARALPWNDPYLLSAAELQLVGGSIQQFQLGEWARGRGLMRRASSHPVFAADPWFLPALESFIAEEQSHSLMLGRFLDRERIPRLASHWLDGIFRRLRKLAGLEVCAMALVTAEVLAIPFYQALRDATRSRLLRSICARILCDEAAHLNYQALTLGLIRRPFKKRGRAIRSFCHATLFHGTAFLLWQQHHRVFRAAGWNFHRFWNESRRGFALLEFRIRQVSLNRADSFDDLKFD